MTAFEALNSRIVACERCLRLREWCSEVAQVKRKSFASEEYWGRPVPNFGDPAATGLIVGLAPAAHGANRTGRMFTGDRSGDWLYRALFEAGLASQAEAVAAGDGLALRGVLITATCHCAPPANKPLPSEIAECEGHLVDTVALRPWRAVLCLGGVAWGRALAVLGAPGRPKFGHGVEASWPGGPLMIGSYHPSQQNTFTGRLTREMLADVVGRFARTL